MRIQVFLLSYWFAKEVSALVNCDFLCLLVYPSNFAGINLPYDLSSLMDLRVVDIQFVQLLICF